MAGTATIPAAQELRLPREGSSTGSFDAGRRQWASTRDGFQRVSQGSRFPRTRWDWPWRP